MAEAADLVVGAVALVGTFCDCIELFSYITVSRDFRGDYHFLSLKLDIERLRLLQWADRVRLLQTDYDRRLEEPATKDIIARTLSQIGIFLGKGGNLENRYGMKKVEEVPATSNTSSIVDSTPSREATVWASKS